ncbi:MAG: zf-HC2 domain-containing protein [Verrucomicrobia bacterium]|nr:zf-HC2 domain-containing protein [Verrucomicrobiota bacterium]
MSTQASEHYAPQDWSAYLDGELPAARRAAMREHLRQCPSCAAILRSFEAVQRGAEQLAQEPAPTRPQLRTRLVAVGAAVITQSRTRRRWLLCLGTVLVLVILAGLVAALWHGIEQRSTPSPAVADSKARVTLERVLITRYFVEPPSLEYDVTIHNGDSRPLEIIRVIVSDPMGEKERPVASALRVEPGQTLQRVFSRPVGENTQLRPGSYRILLETSDGRLVAEKVVP